MQSHQLNLEKLYATTAYSYQQDDHETLGNCIEKWQKLSPSLKEDFTRQIVDWGLQCQSCQESKEEFIRGVSQRKQFELMRFWFSTNKIELYDFLLKNQDIHGAERQQFIRIMSNVRDFLKVALERQLNKPTDIEERFFLELEKRDVDVFNALVSILQKKYSSLSRLLEHPVTTSLQSRLLRIKLSEEGQKELNRVFKQFYLPVAFGLETKAERMPDAVIMKILHYANNISSMRLSRKFYILLKHAHLSGQANKEALVEMKKNHDEKCMQLYKFDKIIWRSGAMLRTIDRELKSPAKDRRPIPWRSYLLLGSIEILFIADMIWMGSEMFRSINLENQVYNTRDPEDDFRTCADLTLVHYPSEVCNPKIWWLKAVCSAVCHEYQFHHGFWKLPAIFGGYLGLGFLMSLCYEDPAFTVSAVKDYRNNLPVTSYPSALKYKLQKLLALEEKEVDATLSVQHTTAMIQALRDETKKNKNNFLKLHSIDHKKPKKMLKSLRSIYCNQLTVFESKSESKMNVQNTQHEFKESKRNRSPAEVKIDVFDGVGLEAPLLRDSAPRNSWCSSCVVM